jgi:hypothetical protein
MPGRTLTIIRAAFLDLDEIALGSLVPDPKNPGMDYFPIKKWEFLPDDVSVHHVENLQQLLAKEKHRGIYGKLTQAFSVNITTQTDSKVVLIAPKSTVYYIKHPNNHFTGLCKDGATKAWMERTVKHKSIFLVVGFITVTAANVGYEHNSLGNYGGSADVPVTPIVTHGASMVLPIGGDVLDSGVEVSRGSHAKTASSFIASGERVIGIQYRKVDFQWFSHRNVNNATLKDNQWRMLLGVRSNLSQEVVQAELLEMEVDDPELTEELTEPGCDITVEDGEFMFIDEQG